MKYADFEFGKNTLKFYDSEKVVLESFSPKGQDKTIRFFKKKGFTQWDKKAKIISRSGLSSFRDPFIIEPWNVILIDEAVIYGALVDKNKEDALKGNISDYQVMRETRMSVGKIMNEGLIWVARGEMICHPNSLIYGEVDEIWYDKETGIYYVGDTKTSSSVDKISYWYQLSIYIEILRELNPEVIFSPVGIIDWTKIKKEKWVFNKDFDETPWLEWKGKEIKNTDPVYRAKWNEKRQIPTEETNLLIKRDLAKDKVLDQAKNDLLLIEKYDISSVSDFEYLLGNNANFKKENDLLQQKYEYIKEGIKNSLN